MSLNFELTNYWLPLLWVLIAGTLIGVLPRREEYIFGWTFIRWRRVPAVFLVLPLIMWAGSRANFGDTFVYRMGFRNMPETYTGIQSYMSGVGKDKAFYLMECVLKCTFGNNYKITFTVLAAIQLLCFVSVVRKYSCDYWFSIFVFIASTDYYSWMFNGVRQFTAVTIIFVGTTLYLTGKNLLSVLLIIFASQFHQSALLMLPVIFIIRGKAWNKKTILLILGSVVALIYINQFTSVLDTLLADTQYTNVVSDWQAWKDDGTNPIRVLVYAAPTLLSIAGLRRIREIDDSVINLSVNAGIVSTALGIISIGTSGVFMGRLPIYASLWSTCILLPWELEYCFSLQLGRMIRIVTIICYMAFYYVQCHFTWGLL